MSNPSGIVILLNGYPGVGKSSVAKELLKILPNSRLLEYHSLRAVIDPLIDREKDTDRWMEMKKALLQTLLHNLGSNPPSDSTSPPIYIITSHLCATPSRLSVLHSHLSSSKLPLIHILLNCSTEENLIRLKSSGRVPLGNKNISNVNFSDGSTDTDSGYYPENGGLNVVINGKQILNNNNNENEISNTMMTTSIDGKITDESLLYELRMEEELGRFYASGGIKSTGYNGIGETIEELKKKGLLGEFELNTDYLEIKQTAMLISEYFLQVTRENSWYFRLLNPQRR